MLKENELNLTEDEDIMEFEEDSDSFEFDEDESDFEKDDDFSFDEGDSEKDNNRFDIEEDENESSDIEEGTDSFDFEEDEEEDEKLEEESDEEKAIDLQFEQLCSDLTFEHAEIECDSVVLPNFKKISRQQTLKGLQGLVKQWNVVSPIHVLAMETEGQYWLLDGLRRLAATMENGNTTIPAIIWNFEDKQEGKDNASLISLMINRSQKFDITEQWEMLKLLKKKGNAKPALCEYLLQLEPGDAMKLEDVMTAEGDYDEIREKLLIGKYTIDGAYKKLTAARKKEDKLDKDDSLSMPTDGEERGKGKGKGRGKGNNVESSEGVGEVIDPNEDEEIEADKNANLTMDEVKEILEMSGNIEDADLDEVEDRSDEARGEEVQDKNNRHPLDKDLRTAILNRDKFTCQCCGKGGMSYLPILTVHHRVPVAAGGPDKEENLITLCQNCHMRLHVYTMKGLRVNKDEVSDEEMAILKKIYFYGNEALDAFKKKGIKKAEKDKIMEGGTRHQKPGENLKENNAAYANREKYESSEEENEE